MSSTPFFPANVISFGFAWSEGIAATRTVMIQLGRCGCATGLWAGLVDRCVGCQLFEPHLVIVVQAALVVVDEHGCSDVRQYSTLLGIYQGQRPPCGIPLSYPAGRDHSSHRQCPDQSKLERTSTADNESCCGSVRRYRTGEASRQQGEMDGST